MGNDAIHDHVVLFLNMMATLIKMLLRHLLNVKYVMETPINI
jgi:hypothetical protein